MVKYSLVNYKGLSSYRDLDNEILLDQVVPNFHGFEINEHKVLDPQDIDDFDTIKKYLKVNEDI